MKKGKMIGFRKCLRNALLVSVLASNMLALQPQQASAQALTASFIANSPPLLPKYDKKGNFKTTAKFAMLYDYTTGTILYEKGGFQKMGPSSLTKMMTAYLAFESVHTGRVRLSTKFPISTKSARQQGTRMNLKKGTMVSLDNLIQGLLICSGNDAAIAIAEGLAGSEAAFVKRMNDKAKQLGMKQTNFANPSGMPNDKHVMSPADLIKLSIRLYNDHPEYMRYFRQREFTYGGITRENRNKLLFRHLGVDGFKTGFTVKNRYGIAITAEQKGHRIFMVINGLPSVKERMIEAERMVRYAFNDFKVVKLYSQGQAVQTADVKRGSVSKLPLLAAQDVQLTIPSKSQVKKPEYDIKVSYTKPLVPPIRKGEQVAKMLVLRNGKAVRQMPLLAAIDIR